MSPLTPRNDGNGSVLPREALIRISWADKNAKAVATTDRSVLIIVRPSSEGTGNFFASDGSLLCDEYASIFNASSSPPQPANVEKSASIYSPRTPPTCESPIFDAPHVPPPAPRTHEYCLALGQREGGGPFGGLDCGAWRGFFHLRMSQVAFWQLTLRGRPQNGEDDCREAKLQQAGG